MMVQIGDVICTTRVLERWRYLVSQLVKKAKTEMAFQTNNWYHFNWLSGDQICEQHIHNLDVGCWVKGSYPVECNGMGGREQRMGGDRRLSRRSSTIRSANTRLRTERRCSAKVAI